MPLFHAGNADECSHIPDRRIYWDRSYPTLAAHSVPTPLTSCEFCLFHVLARSLHLGSSLQGGCKCICRIYLVGTEYLALSGFIWFSPIQFVDGGVKPPLWPLGQRATGRTARHRERDYLDTQNPTTQASILLPGVLKLMIFPE